jgi:hypothetical protein
VEFQFRRVAWEIESVDGQLRLSNEPQRRAEAQQWASEHQAMLDELVRLGREWPSGSTPPGDPVEADRWESSTRQHQSALVQLGARISAHAIARPATRELQYTVHYLWVVAATGALAAARGFAFVRRLRRERQAWLVGRCPACGYDLRATPDRCPECGSTAKLAGPHARRLGRVTIVCLLLFVAVAALWVSSNFCRSTLIYADRSYLVEVKDPVGYLTITMATGDSGFVRHTFRFENQAIQPWQRTAASNFKGFGYECTQFQFTIRTLALPFWSLAAASLALPAGAWFIRWFRTPRTHLGAENAPVVVSRFSGSS